MYFFWFFFFFFVCYFFCFFFFFSSRRRHTRLTCDWSSDVCSSDLDLCVVRQDRRLAQSRHDGPLHQRVAVHPNLHLGEEHRHVFVTDPLQRHRHALPNPPSGVRGQLAQPRHHGLRLEQRDPAEARSPAQRQVFVLGRAQLPQHVAVSFLRNRGDELEVGPWSGQAGVLLEVGL